MKNLIKSRRGIAIEIAIGAMFVMIALSIVLVSISGMQTSHMKQDIADLDEKIEKYELMDQIEKDVADGLFTESAEPFTIGAYSISIDETNVYTVTKDGEHILTFTVNADGKTVSWGK